jgi:DNA-binding NtrC family response regulator
MSLHILITDDEQAARYGMAKALACIKGHITEATNGREALDAIENQKPNLVFLDLNMPPVDGKALGGKEVLEQLSDAAKQRCEIIVVTADDSIESAVTCMQLGATDYITKPYEIEQLRAIARRNVRRVALEKRVCDLQDELDEKTALGSLVGISRPMRDLFGRIRRAATAPRNLDVLIYGETGSGKELIARELHRLGDHADGPFIAVNTAAITDSLAESELFGHVKGAFTGAHADRKGVFEQAHGGTLFLDEIGDMPLALQSKLLRVLQDRIVAPVGSTKNVQVDVRVVCATNQNLLAAIEESRFRQDLYYRVRGIELHVPPLRDRREDIVLLVDYFLDRPAHANQDTADDVAPPRPSRAAVDRLLAHHWPGNVRELEQAVLAAAAMAEGESIGPNDWNLTRAGGAGSSADSALGAGSEFATLMGIPLTDAKAQLVERYERHAIAAALDAHRGNVSAAARQLGIHRQSLQQKIKQLGLGSSLGSGTDSGASSDQAEP